MSRPGAPLYSLPTLHFPFRALAARAASGKMGGAREVALACLTGARLVLAADLSAAVPTSARAARLAAARAWFASLALPANLHASFHRLAELAVRGYAEEARGALATVLALARRHLDAASVSELERLIRSGASDRPPPAVDGNLAAAGGTRIFEP